MRRRPPRGLSPEEEALWHAVTGSIAPLHPRPPRPAEMPRPKPAPEAAPRAAASAPARKQPERPAPPAPAVRMDARTHTRMRRGKLSPEARIDLHGMTVAEAHPRLTGFLLDAHGKGFRLVLVITGKGRGGDAGHLLERPGVLRRQLPHWLTLPPLSAIVLQTAEAHARHGGAGAFYVYLRRSR